MGWLCPSPIVHEHRTICVIRYYSKELLISGYYGTAVTFTSTIYTTTQVTY